MRPRDPAISENVPHVVIEVVPTPRDPSLVQVRCAPVNTGPRSAPSRRGRIVATLSVAGAHQLGVAAGVSLTEDLRRELDARVLYERARRQATGWLTKRPLTRAKVSARLDRFALRRDDHAALLAELETAGLIDDAALAVRAAQSRIHRSPVAAAALSATLQRHGISHDDAEVAVREALQHRDPAADARSLATRRLRTLPDTLSETAIQRRLFGYLARRGYDEETAQAAVEYALQNRRSGE